MRIPHLGTHEQSGERPAIIIARVAKTIATIIPCTSNLEALRFPFTHRLEPTKHNGLTQSTIALVFHMRALDVSFIDRKIGKLDAASLAAVRKQARRLIG